MGGKSSNRKSPDEKPRKMELPILTKHQICQEIFERRREFESERALILCFARKKSLRQESVADMWEKRKLWADCMQRERKT